MHHAVIFVLHNVGEIAQKLRLADPLEMVAGDGALRVLRGLKAVSVIEKKAARFTGEDAPAAVGRCDDKKAVVQKTGNGARLAEGKQRGTFRAVLPCNRATAAAKAIAARMRLRECFKRAKALWRDGLKLEAAFKMRNASSAGFAVIIHAVDTPFFFYMMIIKDTVSNKTDFVTF